jgi:hypothetical protein
MGNVNRAKPLRTVSGQVAEQLRRCGVPAEAARLAEVVEATS